MSKFDIAFFMWNSVDKKSSRTDTHLAVLSELRYNVFLGQSFKFIQDFFAGRKISRIIETTIGKTLPSNFENSELSTW